MGETEGVRDRVKREWRPEGGDWIWSSGDLLTAESVGDLGWPTGWAAIQHKKPMPGPARMIEGWRKSA